VGRAIGMLQRRNLIFGSIDMSTMLRIIFLSLAVLLFQSQVSAQANIEESVYLHTNGQTLITGETLYFSAYCTSALTGKPSPLSKILYVELVGEKGAIHQAKVELKDGRGNGELFLSSMIGTGKYQLVAYTRWMRNFETLYQVPITIINPYETFKADMVAGELSPAIQFFPACDILVANLDNTVAFRLTGISANVQAYKGKIVNNEGETVAEFASDIYGLGQFVFKPKQGEKYEAILESPAGALSFHELPKIQKTGTIISLDDSKNFIDVKIQTMPNTDEYGYLVIKSKSTKTRINTKLNGSHLIDKKTLDAGMIQFSVIGLNNAILANRMFSPDFNVLKGEESTETYSPRQPVTKALNLAAGNYSVSVRKKGNFLQSSHSHVLTSAIERSLASTAVDANTYFSDERMKPNAETFFLTSTFLASASFNPRITIMPEVREELLSGKVTKLNGETGENVNVVFSAPDSPYHIRGIVADENGRFNMPFESSSEPFSAYLCTWPVSEEYIFEMDYQFLDKYPAFDYRLTPLDSNQVKEVVAWSIRNQIENAYYKMPKNEEGESKWLPQFQYDFIYVLDEYTRFRTIKETFTEYMPSASVRENRTPIFKSFFDYSAIQENYAPLLLLDGVLVDDKKLVDYSPYKVERISILNNRYFLGPLVLDGVISFETKEGNVDKFSLEGDHLKIDLLGVKPFSRQTPIVNQPKSSEKIPDQRDQLYWNPFLAVSDNQKLEITFHTSDVVGMFELVVEGYDFGGKPVSLVQEFQVKE
jgi:hypothetical protein